MNSNDNFSTEQESYEEEKTQDSSGYASNVDQKGSVQSSEGKRHRSVTQKNKFDTQQNESDTLKDDSPKPKKRHSSITDSYQIIRKIGAGTYGNVFLAQKDQKQFALKQVLRIGRRTGLPLSFLRELKTLSGITHPNIVNFIECKSNIVRNKIEIFMVFEYMPLDLHRYMTSKFIMEESIIENIAYQIFLAVQYLHSKNIIHRDIKPANILVSSDDDILKIKLADFGMSRTVPKEGEIDETCIEVMSSSSSDLNESKDESKIKPENLSKDESKTELKDESKIKLKDESKTKLKDLSKDESKIKLKDLSKNQPKDHSKNQPKNNMEKRAENFFQKIAKSRILLSHGICTLWYRAPEILLERPYNYKIDIWSIGVILLEMICLENKLTGANESDQIDKINDLPNIIETVWQKGVNSNNLRELVEKCLIYDASERITAENALKTRFFKKKVKRGSLSTSSR